MMIIRFLLWWHLVFFFLDMYALSYIYPVAAIGSLPHSLIFYIYQESLKKLHLYVYTPSTAKMYEISAGNNTASLAISPKGKKICFIDNGRIKIHDMILSATYPLLCDAPLYNINSVFWIDNKHLCCCAQQYGYFGIFQIHMNGTVAPIIANNEADYLYPQKINNLLFVVKRIKIKSGYRYQVIRIPFSKQSCQLMDSADTFFSHEGDVDVEAVSSGNLNDRAVDEKRENILLNSGSQSIFFLLMISQKKGFFVRFSFPYDKTAEILSFSYYLLVRKKKRWETHFLFTFTLPRSLVMGDNRLYESLLPLLPRYHNNKIYYTSITTFPHIGLYVCHLDKHTIIPLKCSDEDCFAPCICDEKIWYGSISNSPDNSAIYMSLLINKCYPALF